MESVIMIYHTSRSFTVLRPDRTASNRGSLVDSKLRAQRGGVEGLVRYCTSAMTKFKP